MTSNTIIGRQPILDNQSNIFAYELLFRSEEEISDINGHYATSKVVTDALLSIGLETLVGDKLAFINVDREFLLNPSIETIPKEQFVLEILETVTIDDTVVDRMKTLQEQGYSFALDDFEFTPEQITNFEPIFPYISILKIDVEASEIVKNSQMLRKFSKTFEEYGIELLAEKIESIEDFEAYSGMGCIYFQGYYFAKPTIIEGTSIDPSRSAIIEVMKLLIANEPIEELEKVLSRNPEISINLLKYLNNASFGVKREITSIRQAITLLGMQPLLKWVTLLLYAFPDENNANMKSLIESVLLRAELMKQLALTQNNKPLGDIAYFTGLISMLDTVLHRPIKEILDDMHFGTDIEGAILEHADIIGSILKLAQHLENGNPKKEICDANALQLNYETITNVLFTSYGKVIEMEKDLDN